METREKKKEMERETEEDMEEKKGGDEKIEGG